MKEYTRICARIDLDAVEYNLEMMRRRIPSDTRMMGVIKMDGYGHGAYQIAKFVMEEKDYIWGYATATPDEAALLRKRGIRKPILVLGCTFPEQRDEMILRDIRMTCYTEEMAEDVSERAGRLGKTARIHVKLDTGMSRLGFLISEESADAIARICRLPGIDAEGMFTHFSKADETDKAFTQKQMERYLWMKSRLADKGTVFPLCHCSNSAGIIDMPETAMDLVRAGIAMYGLYPSGEVRRDLVPLRPGMELISHVSHVKWVEPGTSVSYGGTYVTDRRTKIVTVPVGYGDGYPRSLSNKGFVLIHGEKAPILGRVCMDQFMVDATDIDGVQFGDRVILAGEEGGTAVSIDTLADLSGRFNYEFVCDLGKRIPREYIRKGRVVEQMDYFE